MESIEYLLVIWGDGFKLAVFCGEYTPGARVSCVLRGIERGVRKLGLGGRRNLGLSIFWVTKTCIYNEREKKMV